MSKFETIKIYEGTHGSGTCSLKKGFKFSDFKLLIFNVAAIDEYRVFGSTIMSYEHFKKWGAEPSTSTNGNFARYFYISDTEFKAEIFQSVTFLRTFDILGIK